MNNIIIKILYPLESVKNWLAVYALSHNYSTTHMPLCIIHSRPCALCQARVISKQCSYFCCFYCSFATATAALLLQLSDQCRYSVHAEVSAQPSSIVSLWFNCYIQACGAFSQQHNIVQCNIIDCLFIYSFISSKFSNTFMILYQSAKNCFKLRA